MAIVIGCSGSTGSSLLKTILNRHSQIFAGPEAGLFAFPQVMENWEKYKGTILSNQLKTDGWQMRYGMSLLQPAFGWEKTELLELIHQSPSFSDFIHTFFINTLQFSKKKRWVAKTPANAMGMAAFLSYFPEGKTVQTIRNPYDTIASLVSRGLNPYVATGYYVYNTAIASSNMGQERYYHLKYEALVGQPKDTLKQLFDFLQIPFEANILIAQYEKRTEPTAMSGWKHQETAAIKPSSIGRFVELPTAQQALIRAAFASFRISDNYQKKYHIKFNSGEQLCAELDYEYLKPPRNKHTFLLNAYKWKDRFGRIKHGFGWQFFDYIGTIK